MEYFDVELEGTGISYRIPAFEIEHTDDLLEPIKKGIMFAAILNATLMMEDQELESVPAFIINNAQCNIDRAGVEDNLNKALEYYSDLEEYETCITINDLKKKLCIS